MKLLTNSTDYTELLNMANNLHGEYNKSVTFHCYWNGILSEKHLFSILSCYYFNVYKNKHKIILWLENNTPNKYITEIEKYAEIRYYNHKDEISKLSFLKDYICNFGYVTYYSDFIRNILLYNYGGVWFDLDCFILRKFDPLFCSFEKEICLYQWETQLYPNNAIYISLDPYSEKMKKNIEYIIKLNRGWGFQQANLTIDLPLDMLVLPCAWFDASWVSNPYNITFDMFFKDTGKIYNLDTFFKGCFCYHWHNKWNQPIHNNSIVMQLVKNIIDKLHDD